MQRLRNIGFWALFLAATPLWSQRGDVPKKPQYEPPLTRILFVFDGSQSMYGRWQSGSKIDVAKLLMGRMLDSLSSLDSRSFQLALRVYGHQSPVPPQDCDDTRLEVPFSERNIPKIKKALQSIQPKGTTPIARSLLRSANDFPDCANCRNIIILITDGIEACDEDPCAASRMLQKKGIILKPFVIGVGIEDKAKKGFECVGRYFDAADEKSFSDVLGIVISQALDNTTAQIDLLDAQNRPSETDVSLTLYNRVSGRPQYHFVHTLNALGFSDTLILDPLITYDLVVHTLPPVRRDSIVLVPGRHNRVGVEAARGTLELKQPGVRVEGSDVPCIVRLSGQNQTLNVQSLNSTQLYRVGTYDVEILTLPRYVETGLRIDPAKTTTLSIPPSGKVSVQASAGGYGGLFVERGDRLEWVTDLPQGLNRFSFDLQPGDYVLIFRPKNARSTLYSVSKRFSIQSGGSTLVQLK
ncbi:VWA domain-containing protein [bacterium]|nr:VWA domain-containing protein [bacterium]